MISKACPKTCEICPAFSCKSDSLWCQNGGKCVNVTTNSLIGFKCDCSSGYYGSYCQFCNLTQLITFYNFVMKLIKFKLDDPCITNPCKNNGSCKPVGSVGKYICVCLEDECTFNCEICQNNTNQSLNTATASYLNDVNATHNSELIITTRPTILDLKVSFNRIFLKEFYNLKSTESLNFIENFKILVSKF